MESGRQIETCQIDRAAAPNETGCAWDCGILVIAGFVVVVVVGFLGFVPGYATSDLDVVCGGGCNPVGTGGFDLDYLVYEIYTSHSWR